MHLQPFRDSVPSSETLPASLRRERDKPPPPYRRPPSECRFPLIRTLKTTMAARNLEIPLNPPSLKHLFKVYHEIIQFLYFFNFLWKFVEEINWQICRFMLVSKFFPTPFCKMWHAIAGGQQETNFMGDYIWRISQNLVFISEQELTRYMSTSL